MEEGELIIYLVMFAMSLFWSSMVFNSKHYMSKAIFSIISWISWFGLTVLHPVIAANTAVYTMIYVPFAFGILFFLLMFYFAAMGWKEVADQREWSLN